MNDVQTAMNRDHVSQSSEKVTKESVLLRSVLACLAVLALVHQLDTRVVWSEPMSITAQSAIDKPAPRETGSSIPPLDASQPQVIETATFAMG